MTTSTLRSIVNNVEAIQLNHTTFHFRIDNRWLGRGHNRTPVNFFYGAGPGFPERDGKFSMEADKQQIQLISVESKLAAGQNLSGFPGLDTDRPKR